MKIADSSLVTPIPESESGFAPNPQPSARFTDWLADVGMEHLCRPLTLADFGHTSDSARAASDAMDAEVARIRKAAQ